MAKIRVPRVPIETSVSPKEYEVVKNRAEVFHCSRAAVVRYALYLGLKQLVPRYPLDEPPEAEIFNDPYR
jgi:hypothetical protein